MIPFFASMENKPKGTAFDGKDNDEEILWVFREHFILNLSWMFVFVVLFFAPSLVAWISSFFNYNLFELVPGNLLFISMAFWYVFVLGFAFESFITWYFNVFIVTNKRLVDIDFQGLLHRRFSEALLTNIEDITNEVSGASQVLFDYGTVYIQTAGEIRELDFENVPHPTKVQDIISDLSAAATAALGGRDGD